MGDMNTGNEVPRPQHLIVTVFGMYARSRGGALAISELISLMAALNVDAAAVRSSVSRLKRRGVLVSTRLNGIAAYRLSDDLEEVFDEGDRRIFTHTRANIDDPWLLVSFTVPESERPSRHKLRATLLRLGFGQVTGGLWIGPRLLAGELRNTLSRAGLSEYVEYFIGSPFNDKPIAACVSKWWDLDALREHYDTFVHAHPLPPSGTVSNEFAFALYATAITEWRRLPYLDPGIPIELLPAGWVGIKAEQHFESIRQMFAEQAEAFVDSKLLSRQ